jgi:hypothetical protein
MRRSPSSAQLRIAGIEQDQNHTLPPAVAVEVQRVLNRAARRIVENDTPSRAAP